MKNTFKKIYQLVSSGANVITDLKEHTVIAKGEYMNLDNLQTMSRDESIKLIEELHNIFHNSVPDKDETRVSYPFPTNRHPLMKDTLSSHSRRQAAVLLEAAIILSAKSGSVSFENLAQGKWFWQHPNNRRLVLLKEWF